MSGILQKWGLGVEFQVEDGKATVKMGRMNRLVRAGKVQFEKLGDAVSNLGSRLGRVGAILGGIGAGLGLLGKRSSDLAADLEAQMLTFRVMLNDRAKAEALVAKVRKEAAQTPFSQRDLLDTSKRLLRLTGENVDENLKLLRLTESMAALTDGKTPQDAAEFILDAASGGGFERGTEFGIKLFERDFADAGRSGGAEYAAAVISKISEVFADRTHGQDIVGQLANTLRGRKSTLIDSFDLIFTDIGVKMNERLGGRIVDLIELVSSARAPIGRSFDRAFARIDEAWAKYGQPVADAIMGFLGGMSDETKTQLLDLVVMFAMVLAVGTPIAGAMLAVAVALGAVVSAATALWPVITAIAGFLGPELILPVVGAILLAVGLFRAFRQEGESVWDTLKRLGDVVWTALVVGFSILKDAAMAVWSGFSYALGNIMTPLEELGGMLIDLKARTWDWVTSLLGSQSAMSILRAIGFVLGFLIGGAIRLAVAAGKILIGVLGVIHNVLQPVISSLVTFLGAFFGLIDGSLSFKDAFVQMIRGLAGLVVAFVNGLVQIIVGFVETVLRVVEGLIDAIPGVREYFGGEIGLGSASLEAFRNDFARLSNEAALGVQLEDERLARARAEAASPEVNVDVPESVTNVEVCPTLEVDGQELARAGGEQQAEASTRSGRAVDPQTRGRVLRGNGRVELLSPTEVLAS